MTALSQGPRTRKERRLDDRFRFGLMWFNSPSPHVTSKVMADRNPDVLDVDVQIELAQTAESIGMDFLFFADGYTHHGEHSARVGHGEPCLFSPVWASAVMAATRHIGVITTMHTRYLPPAVIARIGANLDVLSGGRWGWNIVPGSKASEAALLGIEDVEDHDARYEMAAEAVEAVKAIWAADGAEVDFKGRYHTVQGTPRGPGPLQRPWPALFNAGVSPAGQKLIASTCDYAFLSVSEDLAKVSAPLAQLGDAVEAAGRPRDAVVAAGSIGVVTAATHREAEEKFAFIRESVDMDAARAWAGAFMGRSQTYQATYQDTEADEIARRVGVAAGSRVLVGTPEEVAEQFIEIHRITGMRGFMVTPLMWSVEELRLLGSVLPHLERAGVWTPPAQRGWSW
ncbi:LLM class flavin-dependent oxidoreductase [Actinomadura scrupuli]|uniref:LLM class flavin-dependent oxidoreductase n=1 Tax=Actinomadura scrupuli TaxID=559629 RepID=UPI003D97F4B0